MARTDRPLHRLDPAEREARALGFLNTFVRVVFRRTHGAPTEDVLGKVVAVAQPTFGTTASLVIIQPTGDRQAIAVSLAQVVRIISAGAFRLRPEEVSTR